MTTAAQSTWPSAPRTHRLDLPRGPGRQLDRVSSTVPPTKPPASGSPQTNGSSAPPLYSTRFKILAAVLLTLAIAAFVAAYLATSEDDGSGSGADGEFVERLLPERDSQIVQQGTVGIDLAPGWEGSLTIDGVAIPEDELDVTASLNLVQFTPGEGQAMRTLPVGNVCAQARAWETATGPDAARTVTWCFDVI
jgi:hypothetical protein